MMVRFHFVLMQNKKIQNWPTVQLRSLDILGHNDYFGSHWHFCVTDNTTTLKEKNFTSTRAKKHHEWVPDGGQKTTKSRKNKQQHNSGILCNPEKNFFGPEFVFGPSFLPFPQVQLPLLSTLWPPDLEFEGLPSWMFVLMISRLDFDLPSSLSSIVCGVDAWMQRNLSQQFLKKKQKKETFIFGICVSFF